ncbi:rRNA pseudouridine synthase [Candidatus Falkowbacteria bacterium CG10_big_fil_rev_8_21_14_0_10_37_14]|uniref:rRNA pseudouridine synthase n=1 Tax=Candidatus Falkowbacteria bacterium CG10_big_fil_rev_8_21_14_0_10_37_14 TaxID=1974561 RepID=A0A2M6WTD3_9BACT|nr:rRNA pseudouridine synthase [Candidatus Falkowbacteria bacterium]PIT96001.1 MAG: rRNA pseudouridine synthase [Candidatus Falkowbacteria bacterium CG10_big_fil_rev_8_21_14_0_10_37_14]
MEVLQKVIAASGQYSRRQAEELIRAKRVTLNEEPAKLGQRAGENDVILIDGKPLYGVAEKLYYKLYKPLDYTCTTRVFESERNIFELLPKTQKLTIVGRLDKDSVGLVILTNDGTLAHHLTHPSFMVKKEYEAMVGGELLPEVLVKKLTKALKSGIDIGEGEGLAWADEATYLGQNVFHMVLTQGRKRQIRRMFEAKGLNVITLKRLSIGGVRLGDMTLGSFQTMNEKEIKMLRNLK